MPEPATTLEQLVQQTRRLHSLPAVAVEVLKLTKDPKVDARAIKQCIETDPALTGKILRVVNSSLFGLAREVSDLNQALALLGTKPLKMLVLGFSLPDSLFLGIGRETLAWYWRRTLAKAVAARQLSENFFQRPGDDAFLAGLLQDLGLLLLAQQLRQPYLRLVERARNSGTDLLALEVEAMGFDHTALSARLLTHWGLPATLVATIGPRPEPPSQDSAAAVQELRRVVHLAELIAQVVADGRSDVLPQVLATGSEYCGLSPDQLRALVEELQKQVSELADAFSLQLRNDLEFAHVLAEAHRQLSEVAADSAGEALRDRYRHRAAEPTSAQSPLEGALEEIRLLSEAITGISAGPQRTLADLDAADDDTVAGGTPPETEGLPGERTTALSDPRPATRSSVASNTHSPRAAIPPSAVADADAALTDQLAALVAHCRQQHCSASLLLIEVDQADRILQMSGIEGLEPPRRCIEAVCREVDHPGASCVPLREACFAMLLPDCDRQQAVRLANHLLAEIRHWAAVLDAWGPHPVGVSIGAATVAMPTPHFPPTELLERADRCLRASHASGGGMVKSIEIY